MTALPGAGFVGIATSKKIGNKPQRNHAKRRFREVLRSLREELQPQLDYVLVALPSSTEAALAEIEGDVRSLIQDVNKRWAGESDST